MSEKFKGKYRIESARMKQWDYGWNASYFVTICTHDRVCFFGDVEDGNMILNDIGNIVEMEWLKTFEMRPDMNLEMGNFVVMPNHFHAIIGIGKNEFNSRRDTERNTECTDAMHCVSGNNSLPKNQFGTQSKNLASIIRGFKIGVTKNARLINPDFAWQSRFHDNIIRNNESYCRISDYITNNPAKWAADKFR